ncbi:hypothetical protein DNTS_020861, partial [Danionella cerebrum]
VENAQEIQVTVTLTEGPDSPPCPPTLVGVSNLSFQASTTTEDHIHETSLISALEMGKEMEDKLPESTETEPELEASKATPASPTKENSSMQTEGQVEEPLDVYSSESSTVNYKVIPDTPEFQSAKQGDKPEKIKVADPEVSCVTDDPESVSLVTESSPAIEMDTTPLSDHSFSSFSSPIEDKHLILKRSPGQSSEGSIKLTQSPFSTEASPRDSSQNQTPTHSFNPAGYSPSVSHTTFFSLTPKIGMGKPAISKRKFSPGRPRAKQGAWSNRSAMSSPSWSPERSDAWDSPQTRPLHGQPIWTQRLGRGSGFPGRRRPRGSNLSGRGGRGRSRLKMESSPVVTPGVSFLDSPYVVKEEEENSMHNTVVMFSTTDSFTLKQDMCVVCGSFGRGAEGRLLACSQCGQCYHPFCVNIKITKVVLSKGWRCLECTVCEACGQASDPGRLLLCDDSTSPGMRCDWQNNYTQCGPCASLTVCPVCMRSYREEELIIQCRLCDRWVHGSCQGLNSDEEVENAADEGFDCTLCRMLTMPSPGGAVAKLMDVSDPPHVAPVQTRVKENEFQRTYTQDGVCLTESGLCQLQSLSAQNSRRRRPKPKLKLKIINQNSVAVLQTPPESSLEPFRDGDMDDCREGDPMDCDGKSDSSPEREHCDDHLKGVDGNDSNKKRKRKPYRPGIGGFMVRQRSKAGQGKGKRTVCRRDSTTSLTENLIGKEEGWNEPDTPVDENPTISEPLEKVKKRYRKKKTKLEETFPSYLQEAFFGKALLDKSRQTKAALETRHFEEEVNHSDSKSQSSSFLDPSSDPLLSTTSTPVSSKARPLLNVEDPLTELVLHSDDDLLGMLSDDLVKPGSESGAILSKLYKIPELEGKDVEELFTAVLSPNPSQPQLPHPPNTGPNASAMPLQNTGEVGGMFPRMPMMNGMMGQSTHFPPNPMGSGTAVSGTFSAVHRMPFPENVREKKFSQMGGDAIAPWASGPVSGTVPPPEVETDTMSNAQRSTLKWEKEETLGEMATVAPVLYTNMNFPNLQDEFPDWATRVKQIAKLWRKASSQERAPYVQKARDNRAALRINKVQLSNDTMKRQQQHPVADVFDPNVPMDTDLLFKDPLKHKESEQEQEWKFRQQMRQKSKQQAKIEATQKLEQVKNEQQQLQKQQQLQFGGDTTNDDSPPQTSSGNESPLQTLTSKDSFSSAHMPGTSTPGISPDDVFLRPQPPPLSSTAKTPSQDSQYPQGPSSQPQSPQMFSPESSGSRPSSPWDPYGKVVGTPRPPTSGSSTPQRGSLTDMPEINRPSPAHESFGSPTPTGADPYAKPPDTPRPSEPFLKPVHPPRPGLLSEQQTRHFLGSGVPGDNIFRPGQPYQCMAQSRMILSDPYSRPLLTPVPGSNESGSVAVFKAPMPPSQMQQEPFGVGQQGLRRGSDTFSQAQHTDPYSNQPLTPHPSMGDGFHNDARIMRPGQGSPFAQPLPMSRNQQRDPYSQAPSIPKSDFPQQTPDPYAQPPGTPRPHNPYAQMPGTPRPHSDPYSQSVSRTEPADQFSQSQLNSRRQSPSRAFDPYAQMPGTPRPGDRYPKSPVSQRMLDPYSLPPGTPRPVKNDSYEQQTTPRTVLVDPCSQPPGAPHLGERNSRPNSRVNLMAHQTDPLGPAQSRMPETLAHSSDSDSLTPKHSGISGEGLSIQQTNPNQTPIHDPFDQGPLTPRMQTGEGLQHDVPGNSANPSDSPNTIQPLLGETEEKMKQRQRLRQLILKQQKEKSAIRREKGLPEATSTVLTEISTVASDSRPQNEMFGRPPPPYPGSMRAPIPDDSQSSRPPFVRDLNIMGMRPQGQRFRFPPGAPNQEQFLRHPHQMHVGPLVDDIPPQMRQHLTVDGVRAIGGNQQMGLPQHFPPRGLPVQQHNIMGQPFIELCHRAPENRVRFPLGPNALEHPSHPQRHHVFMGNQNMAFSGNQGPRYMNPMLGQSQQIHISHLQSSNHMNNLHHSTLAVPVSQSVRSDLVAHSESSLLPGATGEIPMACGGIEKIETDDTVVKDLDDVEVKDLVDEDLDNLNLDTDDAKDLDLETNDLHLDDLLESGKFDLLAYADPELNLEDKKDMFNEDLDLSDHTDDDHGDSSDLHKALSEKRNSRCKGNSAQAHPEGTQGTGNVKLENSLTKEVLDHSGKTIKTEIQPVSSSSCQDDVAGPFEQTCGDIDAGSASALSTLLVKEKVEGTRRESIVSSVTCDPSAETNLDPNIMLQGPPHGHALGCRVDPSLSQRALVGLQTGNQHAPLQGFGASHGQQTDVNLQQLPINPQNQASPFNPGSQIQQCQQNRPLLLDEQPLLLQDLLDQERQEQQQQRQMQAMIRQRSNDPFFPNIDFDAITDPIMKAKMVALKGINKVMVQNSMGMAPIAMNRMPQNQGSHAPDTAGFAPFFGPDGKMPPQIARPNPPNFGPGFGNDSQRKQYEEWLQETQQLLQMQQKFLEEQIGAHRKSKKALSAKQRTAKKAGREFPEEDAEQLKHVTEQQSVVQKQLEQQQRLQPGGMNAMKPMPGMQGPAPGMMPVGSPMGQPMMGSMMPMQHPHFGNPTRMPGWHPGVNGPRMAPHLPPQMALPNSSQPLQARPPAPVAPGGNPVQPGAIAGGNGAGANSSTPHVKFDDNNPFSEGFQERERRERLREQQEKQRVQLMQEVERQRALQRIELEQQGLGISENNGDGLTQIPFSNPELSHEFTQTPRSQHQQQMGSLFPKQGTVPLNFVAPSSDFLQGGEHRPMMHGLSQGRPHGFGGPRTPGHCGADASSYGMDSTASLPANFPGSGQSLIQLYSNIIPEEKGKKKRNRKKKPDDDSDSVRTPSTPHSDITAPLTPCRSDTSSTPTRITGLTSDHDTSEGSNPFGSMTGLPPPSAHENPLSRCTPLRRQSSVCSDTEQRLLLDIKLEKFDTSDCQKDEEEAPKDGSTEECGLVKTEVGNACISSSPATQSSATSTKGDTGIELLKHLLKNKSTPPHLSTPRLNQMSSDGTRSEDEILADSKGSFRQSHIDSLSALNSHLTATSELEAYVPEQCKKKQRNKRLPKNGAEKPPSRWKKRKKDEDERQAVYTSTDTLMSQLKHQLSILPLMEPLIDVNFAHFPPLGIGQLNGENRLSGSFGNASLNGDGDYYSQLIFKQNNLSNPPTPPASLPPTPPPAARQKLLNGFATAEELARKAEVMASKSIGQNQLSAPFKSEDLLGHTITQGTKTVDVPASLPTPPHNNQEELRGQEHSVDRDTPDSYIPSSSPESVVGMEISRYPDLSRVKEEPPSPAVSPVIPILDGKGSEFRQWEIKTEPPSNFLASQFGQLPTCQRSEMVPVSVILNPVAALNIQGVMTALSNMLCVPIPGNFEVNQSSGIEHRSSIDMLRGLKVPHQMPMFHPQSAMRLHRPPLPHQIFSEALVRSDSQMRGNSSGLKPQWCSHCRVVVLGNGVRKCTKDLQINKQGHGGAVDSLVFCSHNCCVLYSASVQNKVQHGKGNQAPPDSENKQNPTKVLHQYSNNMSDLDVHSLAHLQAKQSPPHSSLISFPSITSDTFSGDFKPDALKVTVKLKPRPRAVHNGGDDLRYLAGKRWRALRWRRWSVQIVVPKGNYHLPVEEEVDEMLKKLGTSLRPDPMPKDLRRCCFCHEEGDGLTDGSARLLNLDLDLWVHLNCALWSTEVYETQAGALINVELALRRGLSVRCAYCQQIGATSGCHRLRCTNAYHFTCALRAQCTFFKDKTMLCHLHRPRGINSVGGGLLGTEHELRCFAVFRRVYVQRDEARQIASIIQRGEREHTFRVGSLVLHAVGQLHPQQMQVFHSVTAIFPVGYEASRIYWSMRHGNRRCHYVCSISEKEGEPEFTIRVVEQGYDDLVLTGCSPKGVWDKVLEPVAERRNDTGSLKLFPVYLKGEDLFGLTVSAVTRIMESLPGVESCEQYTFRYGRNPLMQLPLAINPTGCARSEPKACSHIKRPHTLTSISFPKVLQSPGTPVEVAVPVTKQFVHSKSFQYRRMIAEWKTNVYLARSRIQGLGLYAARELEPYMMVIEYIGTIIRNEVANRKEKMYEAQNRGVYMFRIDSEHVIDATITGGPARYINHSCAPNCIAEVVTFERGHKIIISSNRPIQRGEELCYDYKFDLEDDQHKIPCHCGAVNCRKWMN